MATQIAMILHYAFMHGNQKKRLVKQCNHFIFYFIFFFTDVIMVTTLNRSQWLSCVKLAPLLAVWPCRRVTGSPLFTRMHVLARSLPRPAVLFLSSHAARQTAGMRRMRKTDRSRETDRWGGSTSPADHQTDILHTPVLFMQESSGPLSLCLCRKR